MYLYDFNGADTAAGTMPTPSGAPTLTQLHGSWRILGNRAHCDTTPSENPILCVDDGLGDLDITATVSPDGGDCLYVRISDAQNWIRLRVGRYAGSHTITYYTTEYLWQQDYAITYGHIPLIGTHSLTQWSGSYFSAPSFPAQITHGHYGYDPDNYYSDNEIHAHSRQGSPHRVGSRRVRHVMSGSRMEHGVYLEMCANGVISELARVEGISAPSSLRLRAEDTNLKAFINGGSTPVIEVSQSFNVDVARQGIGLGESPYYGSGLDNLCIDTLNTTSNAPGVVAPLGGSTITGSQPFTFRWVFSDPDAGDYQTGFDLRYRKVGDTAWQVASADTADQFWTAPADTFELGYLYEWQVRTRDAAGDPSPHSPVLRFSVIGYGKVAVGGQLKDANSGLVVLGGAQKEISNMSVIEGGIRRPLG